MSHTVERLGELSLQMRNSVVNLTQSWEEISNMFVAPDDALGTRLGYPAEVVAEIRADYMLSQVNGLAYLNRLTDLLRYVSPVSDQLRTLAQRRDQVATAARIVEREFAQRLLFAIPEACDALRNDIATITARTPVLADHAVGLVVAISAQILFAEAALAAYLRRSGPRVWAWAIAAELLESIAVDSIAAYCPVFGQAIVIAKRLREIEEQRFSEFNVGVREQLDYLSLKAAIAKGTESLEPVENSILDFLLARTEYQEQFNVACSRLMGILGILAGEGLGEQRQSEDL